MSLALSLTICMFLVLITGGITTVAMLQQDETGSNMNSRQAYISAKSGLDTFQDALTNNVISDLPASDGDELYYVLYYDLADGNKLKYKTETSEEDARARAKQFAEDSMKSVVGGEGTYFKIENNNGKYKVTALNVTGKYNANVSMNRGDLSFDAVIMTKYTFGLKDDATPPSAPTGSTDTTDTSDPPTDETLPPPSLPNEPVPSTGGRFMMVGQQTCLNETVGDGGAVSTGNLLSRYYSGGVNNAFIAYSPSVENQVYGYSYFPIVYDRFTKCESKEDRSTVSAINEGIYLLGAGSGWKDIDEYYGHYTDEFNIPDRSLGTVSYITQNEKFQMNFNCKFLCIKNNFVSIGQDSKINYCGSEGTGYVVAYLPNEVKFYHIRRDKSEIRQPFTKPQGYYLIKSGSLMCDPATWDARIADSDPSLDYWKDFNLYDTIMDYYDAVNGIPGEIHSACHEDSTITNNVWIVNNTGQFNTNQNPETGFTKDQGTFAYNSGRDNQSVFLAPNTGVTETGYYNWYCGRNFNFQWFRTYDFTVNTDCHINMSASNIILTIGPLVENEFGTEIKVSNWVVGQKGSSWRLYGNKGSGCPATINVMCGFNVKYYDNEGKEQIYPIMAGTYTNMSQEGLNIFSDEGRNYFLNQAVVHSLTDSSVVVKSPSSVASGSSGSVVAGSVSAQTSRIANIFSIFTRGFNLSPMVTTIADTADHTHTLYGAVDDVIKVDKGITSLYYSDSDSDGDTSIHTLVASADTTIQKGISSSDYADYIVFQSGTYKIPSRSGSETSVDIYSYDELMDRAGMSGANYELKDTQPGEVKIIREYY